MPRKWRVNVHGKSVEWREGEPRRTEDLGAGKETYRGDVYRGRAEDRLGPI
jgi:hypothetical protein